MLSGDPWSPASGAHVNFVFEKGAPSFSSFTIGPPVSSPTTSSEDPIQTSQAPENLTEDSQMVAGSFRQVHWKSRAELPQLPWTCRIESQVLLICSAQVLPLVLALLSLGIIVIAIAVDQDQETINLLRCLDGIQFITKEEMAGDFLKPLFSRRQFSYCLFCLTPETKSVQDEVILLFEGRTISLELGQSATNSSLARPSASFDAGTFGYVQDVITCGWTSNESSSKKPPSLPPGIHMHMEEATMAFTWGGSKAMPPRPRLESNAELPWKSKCEQGAADKRLKPSSILSRDHKVNYGSQHRHLLDSEALYLLGYPRSINLRDPSLSEAEGSKRALTSAIRLPNLYAVTFLIWLAILCHRGETISPRMAYSGDELILRLQVKGTCWDPTIGPIYPGLLTRPTFVAEMRSIFSDQRYANIDWHIPVRDSDLAALQTYWVHTQIRGRIPHSQGPDWSSQRYKAKAMAALGTQRATSDSSRGLDHIFPPGLGRDAHLRKAKDLPSPLAPTAHHDDDLAFALQALSVWGPYISKWRAQQMTSLDNLKKALAKVNAQLVSTMDPYVSHVAADRFPAGIAASVILLRWPDRKLPTCFTEGFSIIGDIKESGIFKRLPDSKEPVDLKKDFYGKAAEDFIDNLEDPKATPIPKNAAKLESMVIAENTKGRFYHLMSREDADSFFGKGNWRPMPLFIVEQTNKDRLISDAKRGGHNSVVYELETIFVPTIDFVPECLLGLSREIRNSPWVTEDEKQRAWLPDWAQPVMGTEDLDEAYGQCPAMPSQRGACVVAWYSLTHRSWRYAEANGLVFGLSAAVVGFNRWPALMTAMFRRTMAGLVSNFFDDFCPISLLCDSVSCRDGLRKCAGINGGSFGTSKTVPPGTQRAFIGVYANLDEVSTKGEATFQPREDCIRTIRQTALDLLRKGTCTPGEAAKLRGRAGWASTNLFARLGRVGLAALKKRQYYEGNNTALTPSLKQALVFLANIHNVPPRSISIRGDVQRPLLIYSDASWPSRMDGEKETIIPRIGWIIFDPLSASPPRGFTLIVNESITSRLIKREQQILAVEAFAAAAAPWVSPEIFSKRDSVWFVDNAAAVSTLIRGSAKPEDIDYIATMVAFQNARLHHRPWFEWIDSDSNPSDGLSRLGVEDPWTCSQNWILTDLGDTDWSDLFDTFSLPAMQQESKDHTHHVSITGW